MNKEVRDPLEKISSSLRRAVIVNKCRESDLRNEVNTIQREERRSISSWALKQEKFLKARQRQGPAIQTHRKQKIVFNQDQSITKAYAGKATLPPVVTTKIPSKEPVLGTDLILATNCETKITKAMRLQAKVRSFIEHKPSRVMFNDTVIDDNDNKDLTSAKPVSGLVLEAFDEKSTKNLGSVLQGSRVPTKLRRSTPNVALEEHLCSSFNEENLKSGNRNRLHSVDKLEQTNKSRLPPIISLLPKEEEQTNSRAKQNWRKLRESLSKLIDAREKTDITKMTLAELTRMFEEIKECRYLRVGSHTSYRGDSADTISCKCLACGLKDWSVLRNHMSVPE